MDVSYQPGSESRAPSAPRPSRPPGAYSPFRRGASAKRTEDVGEADFDFTVAVNLKGTFFASQAAGREMIHQGGGRIVNLGSQAGVVAPPGEAVYCMTKAAIPHLTRCLAVGVGWARITVNAVAPTFIQRPARRPRSSDPAFRADARERIAAPAPVGEPTDVAGAVLSSLRRRRRSPPGQTILIDGGWSGPTQAAPRWLRRTPPRKAEPSAGCRRRRGRRPWRCSAGVP